MWSITEEFMLLDRRNGFWKTLRSLQITSPKEKKKITTKMLIDVVVPTYRIKIESLERICSLSVPEEIETLFIIIVENPEERVIGGKTIVEAQCELEKRLRNVANNYNIRVRCNESNIGAPPSRNAGIRESAAEYILFLDDDVLPDFDLLTKYKIGLQKALDSSSEADLLGLIGMVRFSRRENMEIKHAAILMSYLTFMFEISNNPIYEHPAWGVNENLLVRRTAGLKFDVDLLFACGQPWRQVLQTK